MGRLLVKPREARIVDTEEWARDEEDAEVDLLHPVPAAFAKLFAVTERIDPSPPAQGNDH
jgi:hypothetical protein